MKPRIMVSIIVCALLGAFLFVYIRSSPDCSEAHLRELWMAAARKRTNRFPKEFEAVAQSVPDRSIFLATCDTMRVGSVSNLLEWTDFIYFGGVAEGSGVPLIISPGENHGGRFAYVVYNDGNLAKVNPDYAARLILQPWVASGNFTERNIKFFKERINVQIPDKFKARYGPK